MSLLLLIAAFLFTGVTGISNAALGPMHLNGYIGVYSLGFWATGVVMGLVTLASARHHVGKRDVTIGTVMGLAGAVAMVLLLMSLMTVPKVVAFPVRSCGNMALTAVVSCIVWREVVTPRQWLGIACGVAAIYLLV